MSCPKELARRRQNPAFQISCPKWRMDVSELSSRQGVLIEQTRVSGIRPEGALALVGAWSGLVEDEEVDEMIRHIYTRRSGDTGRLVNLED